jgi:2'-5' RNA ligase
VYQKYFIAIVPSEPTLSNITAIKTELFEKYGSKGALRSPAHITLHMPFSWDDEKEEKLITHLESCQFNQSIDIELKNYNCFEPRVIFISVSENERLNELQKNLVQHCKKNLQLFNQADDMRGFHPHITVAFRDLKKPVFYKIWEAYKDKNFQAQFICHHICLMKHLDDQWEVYKIVEFKKSLI